MAAGDGRVGGLGALHGARQGLGAARTGACRAVGREGRGPIGKGRRRRRSLDLPPVHPSRAASLSSRAGRAALARARTRDGRGESRGGWMAGRRPARAPAARGAGGDRLLTPSRSESLQVPPSRSESLRVRVAVIRSHYQVETRRGPFSGRALFSTPAGPRAGPLLVGAGRRISAVNSV